MNTLNDNFQSLSTHIERVLSRMEVQRKASIFPAIWQGLLAGVITTIVLFFFMGDLLITGAVCVPSCLIGTFLYQKQKLDTIYKTDIMPKLVKCLGEDVSYSPQGGINIDNFKSCGLFRKKDKVKLLVEDHIYGKIDKTSFQFCEAHYNYETTSTDDDGKKTHTLFKGMAFEGDFNKNFTGATLLCRQTPKGMPGLSLKEIKLEDATFGKLFKTFTSDEVEARYILTPALQERFVKLTDQIYKMSGEKRVLVSFYENRVMILVPSKKDRFEANILRPMKLQQVKDDFNTMHVMIGVINELNLNRRIWARS